MIRHLPLIVSLVFFGIFSSAIGAALPAQSEATLDLAAQPEAAITVWGRQIAILRAPYEKYSPQDRASVAATRILSIPTGEPGYKVEAIDGSEGKYKGAWIKVNGYRIFGILEGDEDTAANETFNQYKEEVVNNLKAWLDIRENQQRWPLILRGLGFTVLATLAFLAGMAVLFYLARLWLKRLEAPVGARPGIMLGDVDLRPHLVTVETGLIRLCTWAAGLGLGYAWLTIVLNQFPYSQAWGARLTGFFVDLFKHLGQGILAAMPNLFTVAVIFVMTRLFARIVVAFFRNAEAGGVQSLWLEPETARATRRILVVLIWVFALVVAYPYIPGSQSEAFKGVSVFIGLMVSLGSAGMVGQVVGGLVVVYTRAFQTGDYVKVGEHEGIVREIGVLSTKIETRKKEEVTIPNAVLLAATTVNYSRLAKKDGAIVSTTVTIGYDAPWRQVHAMLEMAAGRTQAIRENPPPRVLQKALSDYYPEYLLLFSIDRPEDRYLILSELHGHIQDVFNEYGVQIMSPNFEAQPEGAVLSPKENWYAPPARRE